MAAYVPEELIKRFHDIRRYGADLQEVSNEFTLDFGGDGRGYCECFLPPTSLFLVPRTVRGYAHGMRAPPS